MNEDKSLPIVDVMCKDTDTLEEVIHKLHHSNENWAIRARRFINTLEGGDFQLNFVVPNDN